MAIIANETNFDFDMPQKLVKFGTDIMTNGATPAKVAQWIKDNRFFKSEEEIGVDRSKIKYHLNELLAIHITDSLYKSKNNTRIVDRNNPRYKRLKNNISAELIKEDITRLTELLEKLPRICKVTDDKIEQELEMIWKTYKKIERINIDEEHALTLNSATFLFEHLLNEDITGLSRATCQTYLTNLGIKNVMTGINYNGEKLFQEAGAFIRLSQIMKISPANFNSWLIALKIKDVANLGNWSSMPIKDIKVIHKIRVQLQKARCIDTLDNIDEITRIIKNKLSFLTKLQIRNIVDETKETSVLFQKFKQSEQLSSKIRILVLGDSVAAGLFAKENWASKVFNDLNAKGYDIEIANSSVIGNTTADGIKIIEQDMEFYNPDIVLLTLGGNDALGNNSMLQTSSNIELIIKKIYRHNEKAHVIHGFGVPEKMVENIENASIIKKTLKNHIEKLKTRFKTQVESGLGVFEMLPEEVFKAENCTEEGSYDDIHPRDVTGLIDSALKYLTPIVEKLSQTRKAIDESRPAAAAPSPI